MIRKYWEKAHKKTKIDKISSIELNIILIRFIKKKYGTNAVFECLGRTKTLKEVEEQLTDPMLARLERGNEQVAATFNGHIDF